MPLAGYCWSANGTGAIVDFYRSHLREVVTIHQAMFQRLLLDEDAATETILAELFQDVGNTYLRISEQISERYSRHSLQD
jgi:hypothetical protein